MHNPSSKSEPQMIEAMGSEHQCVYLPDRLARLSYLYPRHGLTANQLDDQLAKGQRRSGPYLYYINCVACRACEPTRVLVDQFKWTRSLRRVETRGDKKINWQIGTARVEPSRVELYNLHRDERQLGERDEAATDHDYRDFLVETCCQTKEVRYFDGDHLIGITIVDVGIESLSAVYTYFDPQYEPWSIGTYAVLKLLRIAESVKMRYVYLGLFVADNPHLRYKSRFVPQERLIDGNWSRFDEPSIDWTHFNISEEKTDDAQ